MTIKIKTISECLPEGIHALVQAAEQEGYRHIMRLVEEWSEGENRFDRVGEKLVAAFEADHVIGIGGMTLEPTRLDWLRMRRFYVLQNHRRTGVARMLANHLINHAHPITDTVTVHAGDERAGYFWQAIGFRPCPSESYTHVFRLG